MHATWENDWDIICDVYHIKLGCLICSYQVGRLPVGSVHQVEVVAINVYGKGQVELFRPGSVQPASLVATIDGVPMDVDAVTGGQMGTGDKMGTIGFDAINVCGKGQEEELFRRGSVHPVGLVATIDTGCQLVKAHHFGFVAIGVCAKGQQIGWRPHGAYHVGCRSN